MFKLREHGFNSGLCLFQAESSPLPLKGLVERKTRTGPSGKVSSVMLLLSSGASPPGTDLQSYTQGVASQDMLAQVPVSGFYRGFIMSAWLLD